MLMIFATYNDILHLFASCRTVAIGQRIERQKAIRAALRFAAEAENAVEPAGVTRIPRNLSCKGRLGIRVRAHCAWDFGCGVRGLAVASLVLGGVVVGVAVACRRDGGLRRGAVRSIDRRRGQPPGRSRHHPLLFPPGPASGSTPSRSTKALKALFATGLFQDVRIRQAGGRLIVTVVENPVINRIQFEGNKRVKDEQLSRNPVEAARHAVARRWCRPTCSASSRSTGATAATTSRVEPKIIELPNNRVDLVFEITEGGKTTRQGASIFVGNRAYSGTGA